MMMLNRNKQKMYYALYGKEVPIYDYYIDSEGNEIPLETGETKIVYENPVEFLGNISLSGGESEAVEFGLNLADYEAILVVAKNTLPIDETSRIWHNTEPTYNEDGTVNESSADYKVVKVSPSLNVDKFVLKKIVK